MRTQVYYSQQLEEANKLIFVKKYQQAIDLLEKNCDPPINVDSLLLQHRYIELNVKLKKSDYIYKKYESLHNQNQENVLAESLYLFASFMSGMITPDKILDKLKTILTNTPDHNPLLYYTLASVYENMNLYKQAIENYEKCLALNPQWYPAYFGLSQVYYKSSNKTKGDQFFYMFEENSPYSVYGNFDTHAKLMDDYLSLNKFEESTQAVKTLSEWWWDHKGYCPVEIQIYENIALAKIEQKHSNTQAAQSYQSKAIEISNQVLAQSNKDPHTLFFIARVFDRFEIKELALKFYKESLKSELSDPDIIQKIGATYFAKGDYDSAKALFDEAYLYHPQNDEIRFCRLVCNLRESNINIEEYLIGKERLKQLLQQNNNPTEILALLHSLHAKFSQDTEVHQHLGEFYFRLGNEKKAKNHYEQMYALDKKNPNAATQFASFLLDIDDINTATPIIQALLNNSSHQDDSNKTVMWLKARLAFANKDYVSSSKISQKLSQSDPWNVNYLVLEALSKSKSHFESKSDSEKLSDIEDPYLLRLYLNKESEIDWSVFNKFTRELEINKNYEIVYLRQKIYFLFSQGSAESLDAFVASVIQFDPIRGSNDLIKLINTNFDHPILYLSLGLLAKTQWQLETSIMWFNQCLHHQEVVSHLRAKAYLEIADSLLWLKSQYKKAIEYAKISLELGHHDIGAIYVCLAHGHTLLGEIDEARRYLSRVDQRSYPEAAFLTGLIHYRDGSIAQAKKVWKPLLTTSSHNLKIHHLKNELMKYYYNDQAPFKQQVS